MANEITPEIVKSVKEFLQPEGRAYFLKELLAHDTIVHLHIIGGGMQVRNHLRGTGLCDDWDDHGLDNNWINIVMKAIADDMEPEDMFIEGVTDDSELII